MIRLNAVFALALACAMSAAGAVEAGAPEEVPRLAASPAPASGTMPTGKTAKVAWDAPVNADGSAVAALAGYKLYWGTASRTYSMNLAIQGTAKTTAMVYIPRGQWYFAVTSVDASGNESVYSVEATTVSP